MKIDLFTDLAIEKTLNPNKTVKLDGTKTVTLEENGFNVTDIRIETEKAARAVGKPCGRYITVEGFTDEKVKAFAVTVAKNIKKMIVSRPKCVLVAGLGNRSVTPDALGSRVVDKVNVTRVISDVAGVRLQTDVAAIAPGVLGITGIETAEILLGICDKINPDVVVAVDSLCARELHRIATVVQMTDTGIHPGGGLQNNRSEISSATMGRNVIAIGVPTVVYAKTICHNVMERLARDFDDVNENSIDSVMDSLGDELLESLVVTPKDIDTIIENISTAIAEGLNIAFGTDDLF